MSNLNTGDEAIPFTLPGVDGREHSLSDYREKGAVAVIFSCNHCPYVRAWEDRMVQIQREYADRGAQLLAINANDAGKYPNDGFEEMEKRAAEKGFSFPYLRDGSQETARAYGAERTPEAFVFDRDRRLVYHGTIDDSYDDPSAVTRAYLREALDAALSGQRPPTTETRPVGCTIKWK